MAWVRARNSFKTLLNLDRAKYIMTGKVAGKEEELFYLRFIFNETDHYVGMFQENYATEEEMEQRMQYLCNLLAVRSIDI